MQYLVDYLFEAGPSLSGGMAPSPLTHQELLAWQINMRRMLQPWEVDMIRRLSIDWVAESHLATDPERPEPWSSGEVSAEELNAVANSLRATIRRMAA